MCEVEMESFKSRSLYISFNEWPRRTVVSCIRLYSIQCLCIYVHRRQRFLMSEIGNFTSIGRFFVTFSTVFKSAKNSGFFDTPTDFVCIQNFWSFHFVCKTLKLIVPRMAPNGKTALEKVSYNSI